MGELFLGEIREQPAALRRLLEHRDTFAEVGRALRERSPDVVRLVGHGSSDNAASYGVYAFGLLPGLTAMRDSISLSVYYDAQLDLSRSVVLGLSQSGRTPDVVEYVTRARARGALTVAITNDTESALAQAAELVLPLSAGEEHAVAATKTYLNQIAALALVAACATDRCDEIAGSIAKVADLLESALPDMERSAQEVGVAFAYVGRMYVIGRGIEFATAREIAIKLTETCRVAAEPLTSTDLAHGPIAALDPLFPVWAIASADRAFPALVEAARRAREAGATLVASGSAARQIEGAAYMLPTPNAPDLLLTPLLSVVPGQLVANALARAKGLDPDRPIGLTKVTLAQ
jgi:glucosamine--fructose-6-phosphate aminotransferase (isomerizing)